jgi:hypothetical protein
MTKASNVILVHGAWADGSSWSKVIPLLLDGGLRVIAVQLPLTSLNDDVATVKRAVALEDGPSSWWATRMEALSSRKPVVIPKWRGLFTSPRSRPMWANRWVPLARASNRRLWDQRSGPTHRVS